MAITWTVDLATGVEKIDDQHKELFRRADNLLDSCRRGEGRKEVDKLIRFLEDYVIEHFTEEESHMSSSNYPDFSRHRKLHLEFMGDFSELKRQFEQDGPGVYIVVGVNRLVVDWLTNHIRKEDKALGKFLMSRK